MHDVVVRPLEPGRRREKEMPGKGSFWHRSFPTQSMITPRQYFSFMAIVQNEFCNFNELIDRSFCTKHAPASKHLSTRSACPKKVVPNGAAPHRAKGSMLDGLPSLVVLKKLQVLSLPEIRNSCEQPEMVQKQKLVWNPNRDAYYRERLANIPMICGSNRL